MYFSGYVKGLVIVIIMGFVYVYVVWSKYVVGELWCVFVFVGVMMVFIVFYILIFM